MSIYYGIIWHMRENLSAIRVRLLGGEDEYLPQLAGDMDIPPAERIKYTAFKRNDAVTQILVGMFPLTIPNDASYDGNSIRAAMEDMFTELYMEAYNRGWEDREIFATHR